MKSVIGEAWDGLGDVRRRTVSRTRRGRRIARARCTAAPRPRATTPCARRPSDRSEMPQTDCSVQLSITVQPGYDKLQVFVDVYMSVQIYMFFINP
ncbi:hypothetical protein HW555_004415 [Spodoptera exigua]|uniref:Uncharacterized protein n=1 Tax=Spodoptera exigua TaxID=7107 RepID=A0A835GL58_SPOEX|nr:hypothetical protein HW555_004415 [Spodoptera exigua]